MIVFNTVTTAVFTVLDLDLKCLATDKNYFTNEYNFSFTVNPCNYLSLAPNPAYYVYY